MPKPIDHIAYLSQDIGPRPAGTEEEQKAAQYIVEQLQQEAGLVAAIEDFRGETNGELPTMLCALVSFLFALLTFFLPAIKILAFAITLITALLYLAESLGYPILSRYFHQGVSQNVVAKYEPEPSSHGGSVRRRKIIIVANYDSDRVRSELNESSIKFIPLLKKIVLGAMLAIPFLLLIRILFFSDVSGGASLFIHILLGITMFFTSLPVVAFVLHKTAPYNEAANCNASGVAVMLELARQIGRRRASREGLEDEFGRGTTIHGEERARALGLIDEETDLIYEVPEFCPPASAPLSQDERLASAKMAIAAMTGKEVSLRSNESVAQNLVQVKAPSKEEARKESVSEFRGEIREALTHAQGAEHLEPGVIDEDEVERKPRFGRTGPYVQDAQMHEDAEEPSQVVQPDSDTEIPSAVLQDEGLEDLSIAENAELLDEREKVDPWYSAPLKSEVPEWFVRAQEKAKKTDEEEDAQIQRSRYADALDSALEKESSKESFNRREQAQRREERIRQLHEDIMETNAPRRSSQTEQETQDAVSAAIIEKEQVDRQKDTAEDSASLEYDDLGGTKAMPPIDVSNFRKEGFREDSSKADTQSLSSVQMPEKRVGSGKVRTSNIPEISNGISSSSSVSRKPILLPDIGTTGSHAPIAKAKQQRAPLAMDGPESTQDAAKSLLTLLPTIDGDTASDTAHLLDKEESGTDLDKEGLGASKSLDTHPSSSASYEISGQNEGSETAAQNIVTTAGAFGASGMTGTFKPIADELLKDADPEDMYVEDADDSVFENTLTETGAFAGPGYVEMPKSRVHRFFERFGSKKNKEEASSAQEWLDVDDDFDAREAGAARGGWDSFRGNENELEEDEGASSRKDKDSWEGGAFSLASKKTRQSTPETEESSWEKQEEDVSYYTSSEADDKTSELEEIHKFYGRALNTETWFVALGSQLANNGGIKAFLKEHEQELRGAIIISLEALGDGDLCYLEKEGLRGKQGTSSRLKRYIKRTSSETNIPIDTRDVLWREGLASVVGQKGLQTISLAGMSGVKPAHFASENDLIDNIDEEKLLRNTEFAMELIRSI